MNNRSLFQSFSKEYKNNKKAWYQNKDKDKDKGW